MVTFSNSHYAVIYADCPWAYDNPQNFDSARGGTPYSQMSITELCALPVHTLAANDCLLFMWATMPKLPEAVRVMAAWGFKYTTCAFTWVKRTKAGGIYSGMGYWTNGNAELCLLGKKGRPQRVAKNVKQIVEAPRGRHSEKPAEVRDRIVALMGDLPRIELFARQRVSGWHAWGNEVPDQETANYTDSHPLADSSETAAAYHTACTSAEST